MVSSRSILNLLYIVVLASTKNTQKQSNRSVEVDFGGIQWPRIFRLHYGGGSRSHHIQRHRLTTATCMVQRWAKMKNPDRRVWINFDLRVLRLHSFQQFSYDFRGSTWEPKWFPTKTDFWRTRMCKQILRLHPGILMLCRLQALLQPDLLSFNSALMLLQWRHGDEHEVKVQWCNMIFSRNRWWMDDGHVKRFSLNFLEETALKFLGCPAVWCRRAIKLFAALPRRRLWPDVISFSSFGSMLRQLPDLCVTMVLVSCLSLKRFQRFWPNRRWHLGHLSFDIILLAKILVHYYPI